MDSKIRIRTDYFRLYKFRQRYTASGRLGHHCKRCGSKTKLEYAHLIRADYGKGRGSQTRIREVVRNPTAFIRLCSACHNEYDME